MAKDADTVVEGRGTSSSVVDIPNAHALVEQARDNFDSDVIRATRTRVNSEATAALDLSKIRPERGGKVISASVRGDKILYAAEDSEGRVYKGVKPFKASKG